MLSELNFYVKKTYISLSFTASDSYFCEEYTPKTAENEWYNQLHTLSQLLFITFYDYKTSQNSLI